MFLQRLAQAIAPILLPLIINELERLLHADLNGDGTIGGVRKLPRTEGSRSDVG